MHRVDVTPLKFEMDPQNKQYGKSELFLRNHHFQVSHLTSGVCLEYMFAYAFTSIYCARIPHETFSVDLPSQPLKPRSRQRMIPCLKLFHHVQKLPKYKIDPQLSDFLTPDQNHKHELVEISGFKLRDSNSNCLWGLPALHKSRRVPWLYTHVMRLHQVR